MNKYVNTSSNNVFFNEQYDGEDIHEKIERVRTTEEPIEADGNGGNIYTQRKDGVIPEYNVRTDKWDMALETMDEYNKTKIARAEAYTLETESETTGAPEGE